MLMTAAAKQFVDIHHSDVPKNDIIYYRVKLQLLEAQLAWFRALLAEEVSKQIESQQAKNRPLADSLDFQEALHKGRGLFDKFRNYHKVADGRTTVDFFVASVKNYKSAHFTGEKGGEI